MLKSVKLPRMSDSMSDEQKQEIIDAWEQASVIGKQIASGQIQPGTLYADIVNKYAKPIQS